MIQLIHTAAVSDFECLRTSNRFYQLLVPDAYQVDTVPELGTFFIFARVAADFTVYWNSVPDVAVLAIWILTSV